MEAPRTDSSTSSPLLNECIEMAAKERQSVAQTLVLSKSSLKMQSRRRRACSLRPRIGHVQATQLTRVTLLNMKGSCDCSASSKHNFLVLSKIAVISAILPTACPAPLRLGSEKKEIARCGIHKNIFYGSKFLMLHLEERRGEGRALIIFAKGSS